MLEKARYTYEGRLRRAVTKNGETLDALMYALITDKYVRRTFELRATTQNTEPNTEHEPGSENPEV